MTYPAPDVLPYDEWFDPNHDWQNPLDSMPVATDDKKTLHEIMYDEATKNGSTISQGGSEFLHEANPRPEEKVAEWITDEYAPSDVEYDIPYDPNYKPDGPVPGSPMLDG
tara:strand:+ start:3346 stop:3675 length:330 start_codon:yes stop_codon:yes gene_type:complete